MTPMMLAAVLAAAQAPSAAPSATPAAAVPARDADRPVCRSEPVDGTRFMHKVCKTQAQWDAERDQAQRLLRQRPGVSASNAQPGF